MEKNKIEIYHNTRCSKSRCALEFLKEKDFDVTIRDYIKQPPTKVELKQLLAKLGVKPFDIVRKKEPIYLEKFKNKTFTDNEWIQLLIENPILIERPIVIDGYGAIIARPAELLADFIKRKKPKI